MSDWSIDLSGILPVTRLLQRSPGICLTEVTEVLHPCRTVKGTVVNRKWMRHKLLGMRPSEHPTGDWLPSGAGVTHRGEDGLGGVCYHGTQSSHLEQICSLMHLLPATETAMGREGVYVSDAFFWPSPMHFQSDLAEVVSGFNVFSK